MIVVCHVPQAIQKTEKNGMIILHILSSVVADSGRYTVTAKNDIGEDSGEINVIVQCMYPLLFVESIYLVVVFVLGTYKGYCITMAFVRQSTASAIVFKCPMIVLF